MLNNKITIIGKLQYRKGFHVLVYVEGVERDQLLGRFTLPGLTN